MNEKISKAAIIIASLNENNVKVNDIYSKENYVMVNITDKNNVTGDVVIVFCNSDTEARIITGDLNNR